MSDPVNTLVSYRPKKGKAADLLALIEQHAPALRASGLITSEPVRVWQAEDKRSGDEYFVEMFQWKDEDASTTAHQTPEIMAVWEPMGVILDDMSIVQLQPLDLSD